MTIAQAAKEGGIEKRVLWNAVAKGAIVVVRIGPGSIRISKAELETFLRAHSLSYPIRPH